MSTSEREVLRRLAARVREIAENPGMARRRELWYRHNALRGKRPLVLCFPEGAWGELIGPGNLQCRDEQLRTWEWELRAKIFWWEHIRDDNVIEPYFSINWAVDAGDFGVRIPYTFGDNRGSYVWDPPLKDLGRDMGMLRPRMFRVDRPRTQAALERADEMFGDLLPVRVRGMLWWTVGLTWEAVKLVGIEALMVAMCDQPEHVHRLMAFLRDDQRRFMEWCEVEKLLTPNDREDYVGSGGVGYTHELGGGGSTAQGTALGRQWGFGESQETVGISPQMFDEFVLPYQVPLLEKFGINCYGCCEGLEHRIDLVMKHVPRLRRVSVAPLARQEVLAEKLGREYIFSRKVNPVPVCVDFDEGLIRSDLRHTLALAGKFPLEFILKDTHTVQGEPGRITRWVKVAYEEIDRYMGDDQGVQRP